MNIKHIILFSLLIFTQNCFAGSALKICIDGNCKTSVHTIIPNDKWTSISEIFIEPAQTAHKERELISKALAIIEKTSLSVLADRSVKDFSAEDLHDRMNNRDQTLNYKAYITLFLNHNFIRHHFLRKTEHRSSWVGMNEYSIVIQDRSNGELYALDASKTDYSEKPDIVHLKSWKNRKTVKRLSDKAINIIGNSKTHFKNHVE
jgi:hypothetical protein